MVKIYLSESRPLRLSALCILYMSQGLPDGFVRSGLKNYLIAHGASTEAIGDLVALVSLPWALKWVWGPVIDRFSHSTLGRRRPWILGAQFGMGLTMATVMLIPDLPDNIRLLSAFVLAINCFSSMQDVAIDAMAIDLVPAEERGVTNGLMFASARFGSIIGGGVVGYCMLTYGVREGIALQLLILLLIGMIPLWLRERRGDAILPSPRRRNVQASGRPEGVTSMWQLFGRLRVAFAQRSSMMAALLAGVSLAATSAHLVFWPVYLQRQLGWSSKSYLLVESVYAPIVELVGSVLGGVLASWLGAKRSVILSILGLALCWFAYAAGANWWTNKTLVTGLSCAVTGFGGFFQVAMFALFMGVCRGPVAATQFSAYMALLNVSGSWGSSLAGRVGPATDLTKVFVGLALFQLAMIPIVALIKPHKTPAAESAAAPAPPTTP